MTNLPPPMPSFRNDQQQPSRGGDSAASNAAMPFGGAHGGITVLTAADDDDDYTALPVTSAQLKHAAGGHMGDDVLQEAGGEYVALELSDLPNINNSSFGNNSSNNNNNDMGNKMQEAGGEYAALQLKKPVTVSESLPTAAIVFVHNRNQTYSAAPHLGAKNTDTGATRVFPKHMK